MKKLNSKTTIDYERLSFTLTRRIKRELLLEAAIKYDRALDMISDA